MNDPATPLPNGTLCPQCGYDLGGLAVGGVCPECGRTLGETDARRAVLLPAYLKRCRLRLPWWIMLWLLIVLAFVLLGLRTQWSGSLAMTTGLLIAALLGFVLAANGFWRGPRGSRAFFRAYWLDNLWVLLVPLVLFEIIASAVWISGRWGRVSGLLIFVWAALLVAMPNVFLWRLHVLQMRMGIADTLPASAYGVGALLAIIVGMLGFAVLPF